MKIIDFKDVSHFCYGGKANQLARLFQAGYPIPKGFIFPSEYLSEIGSYANFLWRQCLTYFKKGEAFALRSSVNLEDGKYASFAGMFFSQLNITTFEQLMDALIASISALKSPQVAAYCKKKGIDFESLALNIVIQEMVSPDFSGVCFTVDPGSGVDTHILVEAVSGLGDALVSGRINPDAYLFDWYQETLVSPKKVDQSMLSTAQLDLIVQVSLSIQELFGEPQDIEWAICGDEVFVLQARPLTHIEFKVEDDWTNADFKDGGIAADITTPLMYGLYEEAFSTSIEHYLESVSLLDKSLKAPSTRPWCMHRMLYAYWNLSSVKTCVQKIPGFVERKFDEDLGIEPRYPGKGKVTHYTLASLFRGIKSLWKIKQQVRRILEQSEQELASLDKVIHAYQYLNWFSLDFEARIERFTQLINIDYLKVEQAYFKLIYIHSNNTTLFKELLEKHGLDGDEIYLKLVSGLRNISHLKPSLALWEITKKINLDDELLSHYREQSVDELVNQFADKQLPAIQESIEDFLCHFGYHSDQELDISKPSWEEDPSKVFELLQAYILDPSVGESFSQINTDGFEQKELDQVAGKHISASMRSAIVDHRRLLWLREAFRDRSTKMYYQIRRACLAIGDIFFEEKLLDNVTDIFFLPPAMISNMKYEKSLLSKTIAKNRMRYRGFRNFRPPNELWRNKVEENSFKHQVGRELSGIACAFGEVKGEVAIVYTIEQAKTMPSGKIMVTRFTDPGWTALFPKIKGLITETGGMLSHGAIIAREFGIPAVLAVGNATKLLKNGDIIILNGGNGSIQLVDTDA